MGVPHVKMEGMNDTIEAYKTGLYQVLLKVINMKTNVVEQKKYDLNYTDAK